MKMLSDMGSIPIASTIVSTIWVAFTAWIVVIYYGSVKNVGVVVTLIYFRALFFLKNDWF